MTPHALLFTIAAIGISETSYLIRKRKAGERPVCLIGERCHEVLESKWSRLFGVPNDVLGLLFYSMVSVLLAFLLIEIPPLGLWEMLIKISIAGGMAMSLVLLFLQWKVIKAWCFWCVLSALTTFMMGGIVLVSKLAVL